MKRFFVSLISTILAFTAGLVTASSWNSDTEAVAPVIVNASPPCPPHNPQPPAPVQSYSVTPPREFDFGQNGLRLVPERVKLESNSQGYDIDVSFPQILTPDEETSNIRRVNQLIRDTTTKLYQWPLNRGKEAGYLQSNGVRNSVNFTYQVGLATDSFLAIYFIGYSYQGITHNQLEDSFALNYDLTSGRLLKLSDIFKPGSKYLEFISSYSIDELSRVSSERKLNLEKLAPAAQNFDVWQITTNGIMFNFYPCKVAHCAEGEQIVHIPFTALKPMMKPDLPGKFNITYP